MTIPPRPSLPAALCVVLSLLLSGCRTSGFESESLEHMYEHFSRVGRVQTAVIEGDLDEVREPAEWLAEHEGLEGLPPAGAPHQAALRDAARRAAAAPSLTEAARATAAMGKACGDCHTAVGARGRFITGSKPPEPSTMAGRMTLHLWAMDRMWEGLVGASEGVWRQGARALSDAPLHPERLALRPDVEEIMNWVYRLAEEALEAPDFEARADVYGRLLGTCSSCHRLLDVE